jgi:hypothetical protein
MRAIWSAPPPGPAGITSSTGFVGSHAKAGLAATPAMPKAMAADSAVRLIEWFMNAPLEEWFTNYESGFLCTTIQKGFLNNSCR